MLLSALMGSVRRPSWKPYWRYLALNVVVSAATVLVVLLIWGSAHKPPPALATPTIDIVAQIASSVPTATTTVTPSPTPVTYVVKPDDTLFGIAIELGVPLDVLMEANGITNPNSLDVGQVLIVPEVEGGPAATGTPAHDASEATETLTPDVEAPKVIIRGVDGAGILESEAVQILNSGGVAAMESWTLDDVEGHVYIFPDFTLHSGAISVHTAAGTDTVIDLYWGLNMAVWTPGKIITLRDSSGIIQSTFQIPEN